MKLASRLTGKVVAICATAALLVAGLTACGVPNAEFNEDYLVVVNVKAIDCPTAADDRTAVLDDLRATAEFVEDAGSKQTSDILELNEGLPSLKPLSAALSNKIEECGYETNEPSEDPVASGACPDEFVQVAVNHEHNRVDSDFEKKYAAMEVAADNLSEGQKALLLEVSGQDAQVLAIWSHAFGLYKEPNAWEKLVDGDCLSEEGRDLYNQFKGVLTATGTVVEEGVAPSDGYNTGVDNDGNYGASDQPGIGGDLTAIQITLPDGTVVWIMVRCANVVFDRPRVDLPKVPTDDPYARGNADEYGGPNYDPGTGEYIAPENMERPGAAPRVDQPVDDGAGDPPPAVVTGSGGDTVEDTSDDTSDGVVDTEGTPGPTCNPIVQEC